MSNNQSFLSFLTRQSIETELTSIFQVYDIVSNDGGSSQIINNNSNGSTEHISYQLEQEIGDLLVDIGKIFNSKEIYSIAKLEIPSKKIEKESIDLTLINDPLEFVRLKESNASFEYENRQDHIISLLENYSLNNTIVYNVFEFKERELLFINMNKHFSVTCMIAFADIILAGLSNGLIKLFSCEGQTEHKVYSVQEETSSVTALDFTDEANYVIAGYRSGNAILWKTTASQPVKVVDDLINLQPEEKDKSIIAIKFIKYKPTKFYSFICSDESGKLRKITITEGLFKKSVQIDLLLSKNYPFFCLKVMRFTEEEQISYPQFKDIKTSVVVLGNTEGVRVLFMSFEKKDNVEEQTLFTVNDKLNYNTQDASFGIGLTCLFNDESKLSNQVNPETNMIYNHRKFDYSKEQILLAISINNYLFLYVIPVQNNKINDIIIVGKYVHHNSIIRLGFISLSLLYYINKHKAVNIINTKTIVSIDSEENSMNNTKYSKTMKETNNKQSSRMNCKIIDDIKKTNVLVDAKQNSLEKHYNNFIISYPKKMFILSKLRFYEVNLLTWKELLDSMKHSGQWDDVLCLGIEIYSGRITTLAEIPNSELNRKKEMRAYLQQLLRMFIDDKLKDINIGTKLSQGDNKEFINELIKYCIEFCLEIGSLDYLIKSILPEYFINVKPTFFKILELFIFQDKLSNYTLDDETIRKIVEPYIENKNHSRFTQIISCLEKDICNNEFVIKAAKDNNNTSAIIYLFSNKSDQDYFNPIQEIFKKFLLSNEINWEKLISYSHYVSQSSMINLEESKQYTGHKMLWYCDLCIKGKTYGKMKDIQEVKHREVVQKIYCYLFYSNAINSLLDLDSYSYFKIISQLYTNEKVFEMIKLMDYNTYTKILSDYKIVYDYDTNIYPITSNAVIKMLTRICKEKDNFYLNYDFNEFVITISSVISIGKEEIFNAIKSILSYNTKINCDLPEKKIDRFNCHMQLSIPNSAYVKELSNTINKVLDLMEDLSKEECNELLSACTLSQFLWVKIHLLKKNKDHLHCVKVYLDFESKEQKEVFKFIIDTFEEFKARSHDEFIHFKNSILEYFKPLAEISFEEVAKLSEWYDEEKEEIVHKLDNSPNLQLKYVELIIDSKFKKIENNDLQSVSKEMEKMLLLQMELLIKMNKKDQILKNLNERRLYPMQQVLQLCIDNQINEAAIFIYQQLGSFMEALKLSCQELKELFNLIQKCLTKNSPLDNQWLIIIEDLKRNISQSKSICKNYTDMIKDDNDTNVLENHNECHNLWLKFLSKLYSLLNKLEKEGPNDKLKAITLTLSVEIENIIKNICQFIPIPKILNYVTQKSKDANFREFKTLLIKILSSFYNMNNVLVSVKNLLSHSITYHVTDFKKLNRKGGCLHIDKCSACNRRFEQNTNEAILIFKCKHELHSQCIITIKDEILCKVCKLNEVVEKIDRLKRKDSLIGVSVRYNFI